MQYHEQMPAILADVYFSLTHAYKELYLVPGHGTDVIKQAALTCAAIAAVKPIRPPGDIDPQNVDREEYVFANAMLAMKSSCGIVQHPFHKRPFDDRRRAYAAFQKLELACIEPIMNEAAAQDGVLTSMWDLSLSNTDEALINGLVLQFSLYSQMKEADSSFR
ncbi:hypothetical protein [Methylobacterium sp. Leaf111]|uniref:hypothetical protein n=1 Tax=Methylobacterium sp. Leaf111 TaxID=1736257 RepID=UPI000A799BB5|nr:hypothetical protein [Methylobacterium sp. Leaf111]